MYRPGHEPREVVEEWQRVAGEMAWFEEIEREIERDRVRTEEAKLEQAATQAPDARIIRLPHRDKRQRETGAVASDDA